MRVKSGPRRSWAVKGLAHHPWRFCPDLLECFEVPSPWKHVVRVVLAEHACSVRLRGTHGKEKDGNYPASPGSEPDHVTGAKGRGGSGRCQLLLQGQMPPVA